MANFWEEEYTYVETISRKKSHRFGETILLKQKTTGSLVVLKSVSKSNEIGYRQLKNESQFTFQDPGLPWILKVHEDSTHFSMLKKYVPGQTLNEFWSTVKFYHKKKTLKNIVTSLSSSFTVLEKEAIIHGDIKPENILVLLEDDVLKTNIIDFGLAFYTHQIPDRKTLFQLAYAPPELILNHLEIADESTDLFSLCLVIYKLWTGRLPFSHSNPAVMTQLQITHPIEKPFRMPKKIWNILDKGLYKYAFKLPPNRMGKKEVREILKAANQKRYTNYSHFLDQFHF